MRKAGVMASRSKSWDICDVLKKKRRYIHRERGPGAKVFRNDQKNL